MLVWAQILASSDCKTPWLGSHPDPQFQYHDGQSTFGHNNQRQVGAGRPPTRHQVVSGVAPSESCWFGLRFWPRLTAKHPGLAAILVPNSNTMKDRAPLWHNNQRQVGAGRPPTRHQVVSGVAPSESCWFGLRFWSRQTAKHPGLAAILVPNSNTMKDRAPLWHNNQRQVGAGHRNLRKLLNFCLVGLQNTLAWQPSCSLIPMKAELSLRFGCLVT